MEVPFRRAELANTSKPQRLCTEAARVSADPLLFPENVAFGPDYGQEQPEHWRLPPIAELPGDYGISTTDSKIFELGDNGKEGAESDREPWSANSWSDVAASHDGDPMSQFRPEELERWAAGGYEVPGASLERRLSFIRDQPDEITVRRIHPARPYSSPEGPESCAPGWDVVPGLGLQSEPSYTSGLRDSITVRGVASPASNSMAGKLKRRILNGEAIHGSLPAFDSAALEPPLIGISPSALEYEPNPVIFAHLRSAPPSEVVRLAGDNVQVSPLSDTEGVPTSEGVVSSGISSSSSTRLPGDPDTEGLGHTVIQENSTPYRRNKESPPGLDIKADPKQQSTQPFPIPGHDWSSHSDGFVCPYCQRPFRTAGLKNKHVNRKHIRRYKCTTMDCEAAFHLNNDLSRHQQTVHKTAVDSTWKYTNEHCRTPETVFRRKDNFLRHVGRCDRERGGGVAVSRSRTLRGILPQTG
ncbi:hypothetical protein BU26DRAFT_517631 [Trematosphaeria pertusa]|uniref:C2H2-type domain-containing protein n=1 Tax=Trematosphaeria pertusa TaxID=390896 RepID=A0A6A6IJT2_9PLEO|nr:uncharacterized protein BU26DRAFT_517631 [Trematosphaeria pertusa]KAF2250855.1 hypothetical protein BU26DRAFT_517631 [Trematosphaeria pertusa]